MFYLIMPISKTYEKFWQRREFDAMTIFDNGFTAASQIYYTIIAFMHAHLLTPKYKCRVFNFRDVGCATNVATNQETVRNDVNAHSGKSVMQSHSNR